MNFFKFINKKIELIINILQIITIFFLILISSITLFKSIYYYINNVFDDVKIYNINKKILENISFSLTIYLILELLRLIYIRKIKNLIIVTVIIILKILLAKYIKNEVEFNLLGI